MTESPQADAAARFRVGDLDVDLEHETVRRGRETIELPVLSFRLLASLVRHAPGRASKDDLVREAWDGAVVSDETLAQRVRLLRQALGDDSQDPRYIAAVRGRGYRLVCDVVPAGSDAQNALTRFRWPALLGAAALCALALYIGLSDEPGAGGADGNVSLAVLPFEDLSASGTHAYLADGMQEELLTRLTRLGNLDVLSRTSVERYRDTDLDVSEIGAALGAQSVIEGSVRVSGERVRITVQLIDAANDRHVWAEHYDRELSVESLFDIQADVADRIADALALEYSRGAVPATELPTRSIEAYEAYLLGRYLTFRQTPGSLADAVTQLTRAVAIDPQFAEAWASLGWAYSFLGTNYGTLTPREAYPQAREAALRALALDGELGDARSLYADILTWYDWDFAAAEREYRRTLELEPLNVLGYALFLSIHERHDEALALMERRLADAPDDAYAQVNAAWRYLNAGRIEEAVRAAERAADHPDANAALGWALLADKRVDEAAAAFEHDLALAGPRPPQVANLAVARFRGGQQDAGRALLDDLQRLDETGYVSPSLFASVYFAAGDEDAGFERLRAAVAERARGVLFIRVNRSLQPYRDDPRYRELVEAIGFLDGP